MPVNCRREDAGIDFGPGGEGYLRFCYANTLPNLREAVSRLGSYLASYHSQYLP